MISPKTLSAGVAVLALAVPAAAAAGSKWTYPSQADDGRVLVLQNGTKLVLFDRRGKVLSTTDPLGGGGAGVSGPYSPKIAPDGTKVVYDVYVQSSYETPDAVYLDSGWYSIFQDLASGKMLNYVKRYKQASWLADSKTVVAFDDLAVGNVDVGIYVLGHEWNDVGQWLEDVDHPIGGGELTRAEDRVAFVQGPASNDAADVDGNFITLFVGQGHESEPQQAAEIHSVSGTKMRDPSWSPDGKAIAWWETGAGVYRTEFDGTQASVQPKLIISGAGQIDWGPGDVGAGWAPTPTPTPTTTATPTPTPNAKVSVRLPTSVKAGRALRVTVKATGTSTVGVVARDGRKRVANYVGSVTAGRHTLKVRLTAPRSAAAATGAWRSPSPPAPASPAERSGSPADGPWHTPPVPALSETIDPGWAEALAPVEDQLAALGCFLRAEVAAGRGHLPAGPNILRAFQRPLADVRVLIVGQDPYPTPGHAVGLSFSVAPDVRPLPPSLRNIFTEYASDLGHPPPATGDLSPWADRGVLLLNRALTVGPGRPNSHQGRGWEAVTEQAIRALAGRAGHSPLVAILWGRNARNLKPLLGAVPAVESAHPSPLSAANGFFGSRPFSQANALLAAQGAPPIDWRLP